MLQARIVMTQVMDLWHISGAILTDEGGIWAPLATFSDDIPLAPSDDDPHDPSMALLRALRQWSDMTMRR